MPVPPAIAAGLVKVGGFFKALFKSPVFYVVLAFIAIGGGTYLYLKNDKKEAVAEAVQHADSEATVRTYKAKERVSQKAQAIDDRFDALATQTAKDYAHARAQIDVAPTAERDAQAPALLIDTLNQLDRLRGERDANAVPDADVPVG